MDELKKSLLNKSMQIIKNNSDNEQMKKMIDELNTGDGSSVITDDMLLYLINENRDENAKVGKIRRRKS